MLSATDLYATKWIRIGNTLRGHGWLSVYASFVVRGWPQLRRRPLLYKHGLFLRHGPGLLCSGGSLSGRPGVPPRGDVLQTDRRILQLSWKLLQQQLPVRQHLRLMTPH